MNFESHVSDLKKRIKFLWLSSSYPLCQKSVVWVKKKTNRWKKIDVSMLQGVLGVSLPLCVCNVFLITCIVGSNMVIHWSYDKSLIGIKRVRYKYHHDWTEEFQLILLFAGSEWEICVQSRRGHGNYWWGKK